VPVQCWIDRVAIWVEVVFLAVAMNIKKKRWAVSSPLFGKVRTTEAWFHELDFFV
jgi:hypothetical protein